MEKGDYHEPVMVREVIKALHLKKGGLYIDATVGTGGHALEIVKKGGRVLGIDMDPMMLEIAKMRLEKAGRPFKLVSGNFKDIDEIVKKEKVDEVDGILIDLGVSNVHFDTKERGFSFSNPEAPLDMRLNPDSQGVTAADLLNGLREDQLTVLFAKVLPFFKAKKVAKVLILFREQKKFETVADFLEALKDFKGKPGLNPATLPFLALRIAVNSELENLKEALPKAFALLNKGGKLVILSFHSKEEKIIKDFFFSEERENKAKILTKTAITPRDEEIAKNVKARSAKLWILEKSF
ncbi:16S rRNA (cytosine(1402)-N(4))-methyltransferase [Candidatus Woesebacteria bacterium RIFOXYD1_FULL_40_21]|uniref:Ribosomal RNA small subunit methyltransferase H n=1 Tax=Candidatus Woesebacteria bacterium RIFOXYD1_FULL_40_21 TaxID=1802549 RepID=A0A1F8DG83_9BACT|nr:MAG: 16S rRNA (cytosine(1402)-N(4))-methyltransferase [Candidatus Woesebacteria bacterium RIFOXYD1_FULL_40_21]